MRKKTLTLIITLFTICLIFTQTTKTTETKINNDTYTFLKLISQKESNNRLGVVSKRGHLGLYQFHPKTLKQLGMDVTVQKFLKNRDLQDKAMLSYLKQNKKILKNEIEKYSGMNLNGEIITESGILAAAHLSGPESVKTFFKYGKDKTDGNGVRISHYLIKFSGYNLNLE
ncbi:MAG: peptidoglycan-binding protein LysM [Spirochaetes bacterium]|nr:MAG: peptidoglycan-binding protein LysM [Spirochaetota bacterium]